MFESYGLGAAAHEQGARAGETPGLVCAMACSLALCSCSAETDRGEAPRLRPWRARVDPGQQNFRAARHSQLCVCEVARGVNLAIRFQNRVRLAKLVSLRLVGTDAYGRSVERAAGNRRVAARSFIDVQLPVANLPVQSAGVRASSPSSQPTT